MGVFDVYVNVNYVPRHCTFVMTAACFFVSRSDRVQVCCYTLASRILLGA